MPRCLTLSEASYLFSLIRRNYRLIHEHSPNAAKIWTSSLEEPTSPKEKMIRMRLRKKAFQMAVDLCLIWMAGVMPFGKEQARNAPDYVHDIDEFLTMANLEMTKNAELTYPAWLISYLRNEKDYEKLQVLKRQRKEA